MSMALTAGIGLLLAAPVAPTVPTIEAPSDRPADYTLDWRAPPLCPSAFEVHDRIAALRHAEPGGSGALTIVGEVERHGERYVLTLATDYAGRRDRRRVTARACDALAESTAIVVATALDLGVATAIERVPDEPAPNTDATTEPQPSPTPMPTPADDLDVTATTDAPTSTPARATKQPSAPTRPLASLRLAALGELGTLTRVTGGIALGVGAVWPQASLELTGMYLTPRVRRDGLGRGGRFDAGMANLRGCFIARAGRLELPLCGGFELGDLRVDTRGLPPRRLHALSGGPLAAVGVARTWDRVRLSFGLETVVRVFGAAWQLDGVVAFEHVWVSARAVLAVEIRLGRRKSTGPRKKPANLDIR